MFTAWEGWGGGKGNTDDAQMHADRENFQAGDTARIYLYVVHQLKTNKIPTGILTGPSPA